MFFLGGDKEGRWDFNSICSFHECNLCSQVDRGWCPPKTYRNAKVSIFVVHFMNVICRPILRAKWFFDCRSSSVFPSSSSTLVNIISYVIHVIIPSSAVHGVATPVSAVQILLLLLVTKSETTGEIYQNCDQIRNNRWVLLSQKAHSVRINFCLEPPEYAVFAKLSVSQIRSWVALSSLVGWLVVPYGYISTYLHYMMF